jgi:hypothetical protein
VTAKILRRQFEIVLLCRDWLVERNDKALREHMREEGFNPLDGHHEDRTPTHGYEPTREAATAAFAKGWRRE